MKLQDIIQTIEARLASINGTGNYNTKIGTTIVRGQRKFSEDELPGCCLYLGSRSVDAEQGARQKVEATVVIEGHHAVGTSEPGDIGIQMVSDIQRAVESVTNDDRDNLGGLLVGWLRWLSDEINYPDEAGRFVSAQVIYSIPHVRKYGDPE